MTTCPGHFGSINLNFPVLHPGFIDTVLKIIRCVCFFCSELLLTDKDKQNIQRVRDRKQRLSAAAAAAKGKKICPACAGVQPLYSRQSLSIKCDWSKVTFSDPEEAQYCQRPFTAAEIRLILRHISDETYTLLSLNPRASRPENFVLTMLVVPPPIIRPSITISEGSRARGQDDLTSKLCDIVKANTVVKQVLEKEAASIPRLGLSIAAQQVVADLAFQVSTFTNNDLRGQRQSMQRSGLPSKSITSRLKGKEGRIRGSLMGKRVNFSARSVVSPDSQMDIDQVGVPHRVATKLTVPEAVTDWNLDRLRACVRAGPGVLQGAHSVIRAGATVLLEFADREREAKTLKTGDEVERYLRNGDTVLFNRQPSLHKGSMMAYRVRLMPHKTFRLNMAVTLPLNADCDGDELNVHVPQDEDSQTEAKLLMAVPVQIVSPQANKPCIGFVQDAVIGSWLLTRPETKVRHPLAVALWATVQHSRRPLPSPAKLEYAGSEIFSLLFPPDLEYQNTKTGVRIVKGELAAGTLCKITLGATSGGIVHSLYHSHGPARTAEFLSDTQRVVNRWLSHRGFSIKLADCEPSQATDEKVALTIRLADQKVRRILHADAVACLPPEKIEAALSEIANRVLTNVGKVVHASLDEERNALYQAVLCASKGNLINIAQLLGCIGQTSVEGRRILVPDPQGQFGEEATLAKCGFVSSSYFTGLTSTEFFFHTMAGREGLIDTAVKTANTGYLQRRLMKAMETVTVSYDRTIRNAKQSIIQFLYGADNFDATFLVRQPLNCLLTPLAELEAKFCPGREWQAFRDALVALRRQRQRPQGEPDNLVYCPGSVQDVLFMFRAPARAGPSAAPLDPDTVVEAVDTLCSDCCPTQWSRRGGYETLLRWHLRYEAVQSMSRSAFAGALEDVRRRTLCALVAPGEAVGALSAQSISEPLTQLTLNSVDWTTCMAIHWTGPAPPPAPHDAEVGAFIDALIAERPADCQVQPDGVTVYLPLEPGTALALSPDEHGNMVWTELEAVTRHPPVNEDGSNTLVRVTTESGRQVTVTKGKSLLVERDGKLVATDGDKVQVGDRVPVVNELPAAEGCDHLDLHTVFHEREVIFTDVMIAAKEAWATRRRWWAPFEGRSTYARSDTMRHAVEAFPYMLEPGKVRLGNSGMQGGSLPARIPLDREFGFFIGAYLAEGCLTDQQVHIANNDAVYREAVSVWPQRYSINFHTTDEKSRIRNNGTSISVMFHSTLLVWILERTCGRLSAGKRLPGFALAAPDVFVEGLLDGYLSGDGSIPSNGVRVTASSRSMKVRDGISTLLSRFGAKSIFWQQSELNHIKWSIDENGQSQQEKYGEETPMYLMSTTDEGTHQVHRCIRLTLGHKQDRLEQAAATYGRRPKKQRPAPALNDVSLEKIKSLEEVSSSHDFVYDLTVASTRNMTASNGFTARDTFHAAGIKEKNVTLGVPRIKERPPSALLLTQPPSTQGARNRDEMSRTRQGSECNAHCHRASGAHRHHEEHEDAEHAPHPEGQLERPRQRAQRGPGPQNARRHREQRRLRARALLLRERREPGGLRGRPTGAGGHGGARGGEPVGGAHRAGRPSPPAHRALAGRRGVSSRGGLPPARGGLGRKRRGLSAAPAAHLHDPREHAAPGWQPGGGRRAAGLH